MLGLDVPFYFHDGTFEEIAWSDSDAEPGRARADALEALSRIESLPRRAQAVEQRVLVTWD